MSVMVKLQVPVLIRSLTGEPPQWRFYVKPQVEFDVAPLVGDYVDIRGAAPMQLAGVSERDGYVSFSFGLPNSVLVGTLAVVSRGFPYPDTLCVQLHQPDWDYEADLQDQLDGQDWGMFMQMLEQADFVEALVRDA